MDIWHVALLVGAFLTAGFARHEPRCLSWITLLMASFFLSGAYWDAGLPYAPVFGIGCDVAVFLIINLLARYRWEMGLLLTVQAMVLVNIYCLIASSQTVVEIPSWGLPALVAVDAVSIVTVAGLYTSGRREPALYLAEAALAANVVYVITASLGVGISHYLFAATLEALNWFALVIIGGGVAAKRVEGASDGYRVHHRRPSRVRSALAALRSPRAHPPIRK